MAITRKRFSSEQCSTVLIGMILSDEVLNKAAAMYREGLFRVSFADTVAGWCMDFQRQYRRCPGRDIERLYYQRAESLPEEEADLIAKLLSKLSQEYERADKLNISYIMDVMVRLFKANHVRCTVDQVSEMMDQDAVEDAEKALVSFNEVVAPTTGAINPYTDEAAIRRAFDQKEPVFRFPADKERNAFGLMINPYLVRGGFISLMGREKIGKTWMLDLFGHQSAKCRCNTAFFQVGDLSEEDMVLRKHTTLAKKCSSPELLGEEYFHPEDITEVEDDEEEGNLGNGLEVTGKTETIEELLTPEEAARNGAAFAKRLRGKDYKLYTFPNDTVNVQFIQTQLDIAEIVEGWIPDVIVIDYADVLCPEPKSPQEYRHQQNKTWKALRALAQSRHCLVITATQANASSYETVVALSMKSISEDKRKLSHVTGMLGLNQTDTEKELGVLRANWVVLRSGRFKSSGFCYILQCLEIGQAHVASKFLSGKTRKRKSHQDDEDEGD